MKQEYFEIVAPIRWLAIAASVGAWSLASASPVHAQTGTADAPPSPETADAPDDDGEPQPMMGVELDDQAARGHFQVASALFQTGRYVEAGGEFEEAYRLSQRPEMLFNAFVAYRDGSDLERAAEALERYLSVTPESPQNLSLRARLVRMQGRVAEQREVEAERQRALIAQAEANRQREEAERQRREAEARAEAERQRADEAGATSAAARRGWVVVASGAALVAASGVMALIAKSRVDQLETDCPNDRCDDPITLDHDRTRARRAVIATDTLWMSGAVVAGMGLALVLLAGSDDEQASSDGASAFCDGHGCAVSYRRSF